MTIQGDRSQPFSSPPASVSTGERSSVDGWLVSLLYPTSFGCLPYYPQLQLYHTTSPSCHVPCVCTARVSTGHVKPAARIRIDHRGPFDIPERRRVVIQLSVPEFVTELLERRTTPNKTLLRSLFYPRTIINSCSTSRTPQTKMNTQTTGNDQTTKLPESKSKTRQSNPH